MGVVGLLLVLVLGAYASYLQQQTGKLMRQRDDLLVQVKQEQDKMVQVMQQFPPPKPSKTLLEEIADSEAKLSEREKAFEKLKSVGLGRGNGFSGLMQAFARQNVNGLWLIGFSANGAGDQMRINGRALTPDMIPEYLGKLSAEQSMRGRAFTRLQVTQPKPGIEAALPNSQVKPVVLKPNYVDFELSAEKAVGKPLEKSADAPVAKTVSVPTVETRS